MCPPLLLPTIQRPARNKEVAAALETREVGRAWCVCVLGEVPEVSYRQLSLSPRLCIVLRRSHTVLRVPAAVSQRGSLRCSCRSAAAAHSVRTAPRASCMASLRARCVCPTNCTLVVRSQTAEVESCRRSIAAVCLARIAVWARAHVNYRSGSRRYPVCRDLYWGIGRI